MNQDGKFTDERMEDFEALMNQTLQQPTAGQVVNAVIVKITPDEVIVNFGYKTEGVVDRSEFKEEIKIGDNIELTVASFAGGSYVQLSKKALNSDADWQELKLSGADSIQTVKVTGKVDKGYVGKVGEIDAFIPENHIDINTKDIDPKKYIGKTFKATILKFGEGRRKSILLSPKLFLINERNHLKDEFIEKLKVGDILKGVVKTIKEYGVFINIGPIDAFIHKNDISWQRVSNPENLLSVGDNIEAKVIDLKLDEKKVSLGIKQLTPDPFITVEKTFPKDKDLSGVIAARIRVGYIVTLSDGIDGFIPNDEISWLKNARTEITVKDEVECRVIGYDTIHRRVLLSLRAMGDNPWKALKKDNPEGSIVKGKIKSITEFGLFIDFGSIIDGLIRASDISWTDEIKDLNTKYKEGDEVTAKIIKIDEERERISLSIKHLEDNPWSDATKLLPAGKIIDSVITAVTKQGLETELPMKIKARILQADLDKDKQALDKYNVGDTITAAIVRADPKEHIVNLSVKKYQMDSEKKDTKEYMKKIAETDSSFSFGSVFRDKLNKE